MSSISAIYDFGKSFYNGSSLGYKVVSKAQTAAGYLSGRFITKGLCKIPGVNHIIRGVGNTVAYPIGALLDMCTVKRIRNATEQKIYETIKTYLSDTKKTCISYATDAFCSLLGSAAPDSISSFFSSKDTQSVKQRCIDHFCEETDKTILNECMSILNEKIFNDASLTLKKLTKDLSSVLLETVIGNQIYKVVLDLLHDYFTSNKSLLALSIVENADELSGFSITAAITIATGLLYLIPSVIQRCKNYSEKSDFKNEFIPVFKDYLSKIIPQQSIIDLIANNVADIAAENIF